MKTKTKMEIMRSRITPVAKAAAAAICLMAWLCCFTTYGAAATLTVTNTSDSGAGSLRNAINAAAYDGDTINFAPGVNGTIMLTSGQLTISKNLTINGPGANVLTISGGMASRIFYVPPSDQLLISISGLKLTGGYNNESGGAVLMAPSAGPRTSQLVLIECVITGNNSNALGGGLATFSFGELSLVRCTISDNYGRIGGGGISVSGQKTIVRLEGCTLSGNRGGYGGGVYDGGGLAARNSTFSGNTATIQGGGVLADTTTNLSFYNCTLTANTAPEGGGFYSFTNLYLGSNILAGNTAANSPDGYGSVIMANSGYNVIGNTTGLSGLTSTDQQNVNPQLGPLAANGGPTATHALLPGSPAMDKGDPLNSPPTDQRGLSRPMNGRLDVGAYEVDSSGCGPVVTNLNDNGPGSLRCAIASAFSGGAVTVASGLTGTITLTSGQLEIGKSLTINGPGPDKLSVNANNASRVVSISGAGYTAKLAGLKLTGGRVIQNDGGGVLASGGLFYVPSTLTLSNCAITGNVAIGGFGGGLNVGIANFNLTDCNVSGNNAKTGGGIWSYSSQTRLTNCTVSGNNAIDGGGGIARGGYFSAVNSTFSGNSTGGYGGGITDLYGSKTGELTNCTISGNRADYAGGFYGSFISRNTLVFNNTVTTQYPDLNGNIYSLGHNLIGNTNGGAGFAPSDLLNPNPATVRLGPLADNEGKTRTHALLTGSVAIDAGDDAVTQSPIYLATDQRGLARLYNAHVDIGAFEAQTPGCSITINLTNLPGGAVGVAYNQTLTASGGTPGYSFAVSSGTLPSGLMLASNGTLTGSPTTPGNYSFAITVTDANGCTVTINYTLVISNTCSTIILNPATLPAGIVGATYSQTFSAMGGYAPYNFAVTSGALPQGLSLNAATGNLYGTPAAAGTYTFTITVTDGYGCAGSRSYTLTISCAPITLNPAPSGGVLPAGAAGVAYNQTITATPATTYTFTVAQGNLPQGLTLSPTGNLYGTPSVVGTYNFTIKAQTASGCTGQQTYTLAINCPTITLSALPALTLNTPYNQIITATPAGGSYTYAITAGALPNGLMLNASTGVVSGTPTVTGMFNFTITATGFGACTGYRAYSFTISSGACPTITLPALPNGNVGQMYNNSVAATPAGSYSYAVSGTLPPGVTFYNASGLLFGYPATAGTYNFIITATDANNCAASRSYSITIAP